MSSIKFEVIFAGNDSYKINSFTEQTVVRPVVDFRNGNKYVGLRRADDDIEIVSRNDIKGIEKDEVRIIHFILRKTEGFIFQKKTLFDVTISVKYQPSVNTQRKVTQTKVQPKVQYRQAPRRVIQEDREPSMLNPILSAALIADGISSGNFVEAYAGGLIMGLLD
jgi:hypothetical protein